MFTHNPDTVPRIQITMNIPPNEQSYSFTACVKNSISRMIGCRLEWDSWSSRYIPVCATVEQLLKFETEYEEIDTWELNSIVQYTECLPPCIYTEYKLVDEPYKFKQGHTMYLQLATSKVLKRTEEIIYSMESFVSEFGRALGFSFLMVWEALACIVYFLQSNLSHYLQNLSF